MKETCPECNKEFDREIDCKYDPWCPHCQVWLDWIDLPKEEKQKHLAKSF